MYIEEKIPDLLFYMHCYTTGQRGSDVKTAIAAASIFATLSHVIQVSFKDLKLRFISSQCFIDEVMGNIRDRDERKRVESLIEALNSPHFHILRPALSAYFGTINAFEQERCLKNIAEHAAKHDQDYLVSRCLHLLNQDQLNNFLKVTFNNLKEFAKNYLTKIEIKNELAFKKNNTSINKEIKGALQKISQLVNHYINLLMSSLESFTEGGVPKSPWDAVFQLEVYFRLLAIPTAIFQAIKGQLPTQYQNQTAFTLALLSSAGFMYGYRKWLEPKPEKIPSATNLTSLLDHQKLPVIGREIEAEKVVTQLMTNLTAPTRVHPLIVGAPGVGKTAMLSEIARKLALKNIAVHRIHANQLLSLGTAFTSKTVLDEVLVAIKRHKEEIVIAIDDLHLLMKDKEKRTALLSLLETGDPERNIPLFIGVTPIDFETDEEISKFYEKEGYRRRFSPIKLKELENPAIIALMKHAAKSQYPDLKLTTQLCTNLIKENSQKKDALEPEKSLNQLNTLLREKEILLKGGKEADELAELDRSLHNSKLQIARAKDQDLAAHIAAKKKIEEKIGQVKAQLMTRENHLAVYAKKKALLKEAKFQLAHHAKEIVAGKDRLREFLAEHFYLIPAKKKELEKFALENKLEFSVVTS